MLAASNTIRNRKTANAEASAARLRQHRVTGYAALETESYRNSTSIRAEFLRPGRLRSPDTDHLQVVSE
jgi:hypothetical protein